MSAAGNSCIMEKIDLTSTKTVALSIGNHKEAAIYFDKIIPLHSMDTVKGSSLRLTLAKNQQESTVDPMSILKIH